MRAAVAAAVAIFEEGRIVVEAVPAVERSRAAVERVAERTGLRRSCRRRHPRPNR